MAIFKCESCNHIQEAPNEYTGKRVKCPKCKKEGVVHNTVNYVSKLSEQLLVQNKRLSEMQDELKSITNIDNQENLLDIYDPVPIENIDIHNTDLYSQKSHYTPIISWFQQKGLKAEIDPRMMDTTGFFDEVALQIGNNFSIFGPIIRQIKYIQGKEYDTVKLELSKKPNDEVQKITQFCKMLYDFSFVSRYTFQKKEKIIYLKLQEIPRIKNFFNGLWMEWFVLIKLLTLFEEKNITPAIARSVKITFSEKHSNELDIFFLSPNGDPICIECKTGEFRQELNKYFSIQKKLHIKKENFILCVFGLDTKQTTGLTSMYEITVTNEATITQHIQKLL
ncbi:MAG: hypothetical protein L3J47_04620 [Sulfurovum sp.]|nr:hypothetical protein [Sulfurovum sp.]